MLYTRGLISAMLQVEGIRQAQLRYGSKPLTGEQVRYGLENLSLDANRLPPTAVTTPAPARRASSSGTAPSGCSFPTGTRPTTRSSSR